MDEKEKPFSLTKRLMSFRYAFRGITQLVKEEPNFRIHIVVAALVIIAGFLLRISSAEWLIILLTIGFVLAAESLNSAIEKLCDVVSPEVDERIKKIKDMLAATVLITAIIAVIIGLVIFLPYIADII